jgi:ATP-dependent Clp protease ATP-binding subunit ClpA
MSERPLTTRATRALVLADQAADALHDEFIGTEHLLLGLLAEPSPAAHILAELGVTSQRVVEVLIEARRPRPLDGGNHDQPSNAKAKMQGLHHSGERSELPMRDLVSFSDR